MHVKIGYKDKTYIFRESFTPKYSTKECSCILHANSTFFVNLQQVQAFCHHRRIECEIPSLHHFDHILHVNSVSKLNNKCSYEKESSIYRIRKDLIRFTVSNPSMPPSVSCKTDATHLISLNLSSASGVGFLSGWYYVLHNVK